MEKDVYIPFHKPVISESAFEYIRQAATNNKLSSYGYFTNCCQDWLESRFDIPHVMLVKSCTHAIEMALLIEGIGSGDEVIMPSFTFVSVANAVVQRGAIPIFLDCTLDTLNLDPVLIEAAVTKKTKVIIAMHYGGVSCDMDAIMDIAKAHNLIVIEDAAQSIDAYYKGKPLGTIGDYGTISFHDTKNIIAGGGGALYINSSKRSTFLRARHMWERGTNRSEFIQGKVEKYVWIDLGTSYAISELNAAVLWSQLQELDERTTTRVSQWQRYQFALGDSRNIPKTCEHNGHIFALIESSQNKRDALISALEKRGVNATFHYQALHSSPAGQKYSKAVGDLTNTNMVEQGLIRLPLYHSLTGVEQDRIIDAVLAFRSQ